MDRLALHRSLAHIQSHLDEELSLQSLAAMEHRSLAYFSRRFTSFMRETPKQYIARLRLEKAALRLVLLKDQILTIAMDCGYRNHETFCRAFQRRFEISPSDYRKKGRLPAAQRSRTSTSDNCVQNYQLSKTVIRSLQPMSLACIRHLGPYEKVPVGTWDKLSDWAKRNRLPLPYLRLGVALDAPGITPQEQLRFDAAIRVQSHFRSEKVVTHQYFKGGMYALTTSVGPLFTLPMAYAEIFSRILANKTYDCLGVPCLECYSINRTQTNVEIVHTDVAIPVRIRRKM